MSRLPGLDLVRLAKLSRRHETPAYYYDAAVIRDRAARLSSALGGRVEILYAVKANPFPPVLRCLRRLVAGADVASEGELAAALRAGYDPRSISFAGPGKSTRELERALRAGVTVQAESEAELDAIDSIASRSKKGRTPVGLRINPAEEAASGGMKMGGGAKPFGIDEERIPALVRRIRRSRRLLLGGVHVYAGSQILDPAVVVESFRRTLALARRAQELWGEALGFINFGGGFGIPYYEGERPLDLDALRSGLAGVFAAAPPDPSTRCWAESGRYLVGEAGAYVTRVLVRKRSRGKTFLVVDGGMHHHLAASGNLGAVLKKNFPVAVLDRPGPARERVTVAGPLCTPLDTLARDVKLPVMRPGDRLAVLQSGAYALSASPVGFLSRPAARERMT